MIIPSTTIPVQKKPPEMEMTTALLFLSTPLLLLPCLVLLFLLVDYATRFILSIILFRSDSDVVSWEYDSDFYSYSSDDDPVIPMSLDFVKSRYHETLKVRRYERRAQSVECVFCLCDVEEEDEFRELRCNHVFHRACLDRWLEHGHATCPVCRDSLVAAASCEQHDEEEVGEEEEIRQTEGVSLPCRIPSL